MHQVKEKENFKGAFIPSYSLFLLKNIATSQFENRNLASSLKNACLSSSSSHFI
jgi:hypothetical protein